MSIKNIKMRADEIYKQNRKQVLPEFFYIGYVSLLAQYLQSGFFSFFVSLFLSPIAHGYVVCSIQLADQEKPRLDYHHSMVGIIDFARVAPAYLARKAAILFATILAATPTLLSIHNVLPELSLNWMASLGNAFIQTDFFIPDFEILLQLLESPIVILNIIFCIFVYLGLTAFLTPVPYVMELDDFSWSECFGYSFRLMKGQMFDFFKLYISYLPRHVFYWIMTGFVMMVVGSINEFLMLFCLVTSLFFYIEVFKGRFEIAKYLFYKEIRGDNDEKYQGNQEDRY